MSIFPIIPSIKQVHESKFRACTICVYEYIIEREGTGKYRARITTEESLTLPTPWIEPETEISEVIRLCKKVIEDFRDIKIDNAYVLTAKLNYYMQYDYEEKTYYNNADIVKYLLTCYNSKNNG